MLSGFVCSPCHLLFRLQRWLQQVPKSAIELLSEESGVQVVSVVELNHLVEFVRRQEVWGLSFVLRRRPPTPCPLSRTVHHHVDLCSRTPANAFM